MATPPLKRETAEEAIALVDEALRQGYRPIGMTGSGKGALQHAADEAVKAGLVSAPETFKQRVRAGERWGIEPDWGLYRPARFQQPVPRQVVNAAPPLRAPEPGRGERILAIGDLHQDPRHPDRLDVLTWMARYATEQQFPRIIQVGDWSTYDSVNQHDDNSTWAAKTKPGIKDDLDNLKQSLANWRRGINYKPRQTVLYGNHENRLERFENANPEAIDTFTLSRDEAFAQFGWNARRYGELFYVGGVAFTHHPTNGSGRAFGGKTGPQRAANESTVPVVSGHTHRRQVHDSPKIGPTDVISMVEIGCGLPWGTVEDYAKHALTGWWYGVCDLTVADGVITDLAFVSMLTLRARYSDDGGDVRAA